MGVRRLEDRNIRKVFMTGQNRSYAVVLPIEHVRALGLKEGREVTVERVGRNLIVSPRLRR